MAFVFEDLDVYKRALELVESIDALIDSIKGRFPASRIDQLTRASLSVPLNIAEGSGRRKYAERAHFFVISRGSAFECVAILQVLKRKRLIEEQVYICCYEKLTVIAKMLSGLIKHIEAKQVERTKVRPPSTAVIELSQ